MPKIIGVTRRKPRPFRGKLFMRPLGFPKTTLCTKFEVSSSVNFEDIADRLQKFYRSRDLGHALFGGNFAYI